MALAHTLGYPRIGEDRELKKALEKHWSGKLSEETLQLRASRLREYTWKTQSDIGVDIVASNDFSLYDHVLDTSALVGAVPSRFERKGGTVDLETYFSLARGIQSSQSATQNQIEGVVAQEMRKWFDTNYHYLVPEFHPNQKFALTSSKPFDEYLEAKQEGIDTKPILLGPVSFLQLGKAEGKPFNRLTLLENLLPVYEEILEKLDTLGAEWIQLDEPTLVLDLSQEEKEAFTAAYDRLKNASGSTKLLLGTYFGDLRDNLDTALLLPVDAIHLDATGGTNELLDASSRLKDNQQLSAGVVDARNIWVNDLSRSLELLQKLESNIGSDRLLIAPSASLQFVPLDAERETGIDPEVKSWLAFARQKLEEIITLRDALHGDAIALQQVRQNSNLLQEIQQSTKRTNRTVQERLRKEGTGGKRRAPYSERVRAQSKLHNLPALPTTTIGSFPQTLEIRKTRSRHTKGDLAVGEYEEVLHKEIEKVIRVQEEAGLDVLVHGEPERNDMVQFFAERLDGIETTNFGWVQSYGSRCVRPPIIYGDVSRPAGMTTKWIQYAQSLTDKPVKGMLTGPVTIEQWSFGRSDLSRHEVCQQIAFAIRDEVTDLEQQGTKIIQVDEPAFREGLPLRKADQEQYLRWAAEAFRTSIAAAKSDTQIHTHMCYSEFKAIVETIQQLDIDVISLEAARSRLQLVESLEANTQPFAIGPGVWDVHSPRVPEVEELKELIQFALQHIPKEQFWVNPDCGLKTRKWEEVIPSLQNLVAATQLVRSSLQGNA